MNNAFACERNAPTDVEDNQDCNDGDATEYPGVMWYTDVDGDGFGDPNTSNECERGSLTNPLLDNTDCDDADATEYPGVMWYADFDNDNYGDPNTSNVCERGLITNPTTNKQDCNDNDATVYPSAPELCDGQKNDVDADAGTCGDALPANEVDNDLDGHVECTIDNGGWNGSIPTNFTEMLGDDCDDADATEYPGVIWYADVDSDGFGDPNNSAVCEPSTPTDVLDNNDCDDNSVSTNPNIEEYCDGIDNNCDGTIDNSCSYILFADDFDDGDYANNPSWTLSNNDDAPGNIDVSTNEVHFIRTVGGGNGGSISLLYDTNLPVSATTAIEFDVKPTYSNVVSGCGYSCGEYPINIRLNMNLIDGTEVMLQYSYNYRGGSDKSTTTFIRHGFGSAVQDVWLRNEVFIIQDDFPTATTITQIMIFGSGWSFEGSADNIVIYNE